MQNLQYNPWLIHLMTQLLASDRYSPVNIVLSKQGNPFADIPPKFIRSELYRYEFTRLNKNETNWWKRTYRQAYSPIFDLKNMQLKSIFRQMQWKMPKVPMRA